MIVICDWSNQEYVGAQTPQSEGYVSNLAAGIFGNNGTVITFKEKAAFFVWKLSARGDISSYFANCEHLSALIRFWCVRAV